MNLKNFEFKARVDALEPYEHQLMTLNPLFKGIDHQIDTYFNVPKGRLKLREGTLENALIYYERANVNTSKASDIILYQHVPNPALKAILSLQLGVKTCVDKHRKIYFIGPVKFHFDVVQGLGTFIEVEVIDSEGNQSLKALQELCDFYYSFFKIQAHQVVAESYSDLILR